MAHRVAPEPRIMFRCDKAECRRFLTATGWMALWEIASHQGWVVGTTGYALCPEHLPGSL